MNTKDFYYFQMVYETQSINNAAKKLFISPQGLGKIIKNLEEEYDTTFFTRTQNGVLPTESAHVFYKWSKKITSEITWMEDEISQVKKKKQVIRIGCANGVLKVIPLEVILQFAQKNPDVIVEWNEYQNDTVIQKIISSEIEYGLVVGTCGEKELVQKKIHQSNIVLLVYETHPFYDYQYVTLDMLQNEDIVIMNEQFNIYEDFMNACRIQGFHPKIKVKTMDGGTLYHLCAQKIGVAIAPDFADEQVNGVHAIQFREPYHWNIYGTCRKSRVEDTLLKKFESCLKPIILSENGKE